MLRGCSLHLVYIYCLSAAVKETLAVQKAIGKVKSRILYIARALSLPSDRIEEIERVHKDDNRRALAVIATWLQGNFNDLRMPYSVHPEKKYRCPSWWNLVWAIAHRSGGNDPAHAVKIAGEYKSKYFEVDVRSKCVHFSGIVYFSKQVFRRNLVHLRKAFNMSALNNLVRLFFSSVYFCICCIEILLTKSFSGH